MKKTALLFTTLLFVLLSIGQTSLGIPEEIEKAAGKVAATEKKPGYVHYVGEYFGGGIICKVWKDGETEHGIIVGLNDIGKSLPWDSAMALCNSYTSGGFSGWKLPSKEELDAVCQFNQKLHKILFRTGTGLSVFIKGNYWSNSKYETDESGASVWTQVIYPVYADSDCIQNGADKTEAGESARPVRIF